MAKRKIQRAQDLEDVHDASSGDQAEGPIMASSSTVSEVDFEEDGVENEFEKERAALIQRNMAALVELGVQQTAAILGQACAKQQKQQHKSQKKRQKITPSPSPRPRRSYSLRSDGPVEKNKPGEQVQEMADSSETESDDVDWDEVEESNVKRYICENSEKGPCGRCLGDDEEVEMVSQLPCKLVDTSLAQAYSLDVSDNLLVAGGKGGFASIFGIQGLWSQEEGTQNEAHENEVPPLITSKLHGGWISQVQFLHDAGNFISTGNDGIISIWDTSKVLDGMPREIASHDGIHTGGIFSMHELEGRVLTGSKDFCVALSDLGRNSTIQRLHLFDKLHSGVVKSVQWRGSKTFVSAGNDRKVMVTDVRHKSSCVCIPDALSGPLTYAAASPANQNIILVAGTEPVIKLFDIRSPESAVQQFRGHSQKRQARRIYNPCFWINGRYIATGGEGSDLLSLYCTESGRTVSRGSVGFTPSLVKPLSDSSDIIAAAATKAICFYQPEVVRKSDMHSE